MKALIKFTSEAQLRICELLFAFTWSHEILIRKFLTLRLLSHHILKTITTYFLSPSYIIYESQFGILLRVLSPAIIGVYQVWTTSDFSSRF